MGHGCRVWSELSLHNFYWLLELGHELCTEYRRRYKKIHYCKDVLTWCEYNIPELPNIGPTPFYLAVPEELKSPDPVDSYRRYYIRDKSRFAQWKYSPKPEWWPNDL